MEVGLTVRLMGIGIKEKRERIFGTDFRYLMFPFIKFRHMIKALRRKILEILAVWGLKEAKRTHTVINICI